MGSKIVCTREMKIRAKKTGEELVKPHFGSVYLKVHDVQRDGQVYKVDRFKDLQSSSRLRNETVVEQRLMLEVSIVVDQNKVEPGLKEYTVDNTPFVEEHNHIVNLIPNTLYALTVNSDQLRTRKGHTCVAMYPHMSEKGLYGTLLTGIMKTWANHISMDMDIIPWEDEQGLLYNSDSLSPFEVMTLLNSISDRTLKGELTPA